MHWTDEALQGLDTSKPVIINDSKTPSGRAHVGALRGVLIHDAAFRTLKQRGVDVHYRFGCDDYDPVDEIPFGQGEIWRQHLGKPLCNAPPPPGSSATDMADHFITEFWSVFADLGVKCEFYRMRDIYRSGKFNEAIDRILRAAPTVRKIYKEVSNSDRPDNWFPFQTICENCGRIGTTEVTEYDGKEVVYECKPNLVEWAQGCGHRGKVSPFDGRGKMPWKLEWVAKWATFPVAVEGAGEDHNTKGGSRDVAAHCLKAIYGLDAPLNIPYGFVLVGGAKMSSSRGVGVAARDVANFLPPEILRFLMLRTPPKRQANFEPTYEQLVKVFNELDRAHFKTFNDPKLSDDERKTYHLCEVKPEGGEGGFFDCEFGLVLALVQMPHLDVVREFEKIKGSSLTEIELAHLSRRIRAAQVFLEHYATPEERMQLQQTLPAAAAELTVVQRGFLHTLAAMLDGAEWNGEALQSLVFDAARLTPIEQRLAFAALYRVLFDKAAGPKAGNLLAFLDRAWVKKRLLEVPLDQVEFWRATAEPAEKIAAWLKDNAAAIASKEVTTREAGAGSPGAAVAELLITMTDGKRHVKRVMVESGGAEGAKRAVVHF
ncbi:MAG: lysine--tRNA ligase [Phycisphaeraceae bacterium]|nr:lysine--tRNA ligase [Phycisphaeraceae bacterium]